MISTFPVIKHINKEWNGFGGIFVGCASVFLLTAVTTLVYEFPFTLHNFWKIILLIQIIGGVIGFTSTLSHLLSSTHKHNVALTTLRFIFWTIAPLKLCLVQLLVWFAEGIIRFIKWLDKWINRITLPPVICSKDQSS